jgi:hypothetical protein
VAVFEVELVVVAGAVVVEVSPVAVGVSVISD